MRGAGRPDKTNIEVFVNELTQSLEFSLGNRIHQTNGWRCIVLKIDFEVVFAMGGQCFCTGLAEDIGEFVIF